MHTKAQAIPTTCDSPTTPLQEDLMYLASTGHSLSCLLSCPLTRPQALHTLPALAVRRPASWPVPCPVLGLGLTHLACTGCPLVHKHGQGRTRLHGPALCTEDVAHALPVKQAHIWHKQTCRLLMQAGTGKTVARLGHKPGAQAEAPPVACTLWKLFEPHESHRPAPHLR